MTASFRWYNHAFSHLATAGVNLLSDTIMIANIGAGYTPNLASDEFFSTPQAAEITSTGYVAYGARVQNIVLQPATWDFDADDTSFAGGPFSSVRYTVLYDKTPVGISSPSASQMPLLGLIDWGGLVTLNGVIWDASGVGKIIPQ